MDNFIHLHNHTEYSSLDGFSQISKLIEKIKQLEQPAVAITDHGSLNGCYKFYKECKKQEIKPILGIEAYIVREHNTSEHSTHITLLAKNNTGWKNLLKLHKISHQNFYYKPRISFNDLFQHKEGIIVLSGCWGGLLCYHIDKKDNQTAKENLILFQKEFGDDFYIEIMDQRLGHQERLNKELRKLSKSHNIKTVVTNDTHYVNKEHALYQDYLICDQLKTTINADRKLKFDSNEFYIKSRSEMPGTEHDKDTTIEIANKCNVSIEFNGFLLPQQEEQEEDFIKLINNGIEKHNLSNNDIYLKRLREEYKIIKKANLIGYFLTVYDYVQYARNNNILVGPGRGSVGGCLIGYLLGIHSIDPIKHKLLFSRFYNEGRSSSLPDIDIDFPECKISQMREYIKNKYGNEYVAHIGTYTYLHKRSALKLICRVLDVDFQTSNYYSTVIEDEKATEELKKSSNQFKDIAEKTEQFIGLATYNSIHAAGIVISPIKLEEIIPLRINPENGLYVSCWDMKDLEELGLVKFDFLSLNTLDVVQDTLNAINLKLENIPTDDEKTFNLITSSNNVGAFQLSSDGISKIANNMGVKSIDDISVVVALYRPGPINSGLHEQYIRRKYGTEHIEYPHPLLEEVLKDTYGIFVYQEQIIKSVMVLANFTETNADSLRKAIGKKIPSLMKQQKDKFIKGCEKNNIEKLLAAKIWQQIEEFAEYSFNAAHSVGYAYLTYYTSYLKANYPHEFMAAILNNNYDRNDKLSIYLNECNNLNIKIVPPSVINGDYNFIAKNKQIIFGLKGIKGIGEKTAKSIYEQHYDSFEDFCLKFKPTSKILIAFAEAGVFDEFGYKRNQIIEHAGQILELIKSSKTINIKTRLLFSNKTSFNIPDSQELSEELLASMEYNRLNTYLVHNPLMGVDLYTPDELKGNIFIEGYLTNIEEHITKKKQTMAFLTVTTKLGQIEALMFPNTYKNNKDKIRKNSYIAIEGLYEDKLLIKNIWNKT